MDYLINLFSDLISEHLINQVEAGVDALQIFDTHSYKMDFRMHEKYSIEQLKKISKNIRKKYPNIPIIYYTKSSRLRHYNLEQYINCLSLNSNVSIIEEKKDIKKTLCYQGNLDPLLLVAGGNKMIEETNKILEEMKDSFFVFNLGHGVLPQTPIQNVYKLVETVKKFKN
jgi:uroporphyrinogen decarboxylase